MGDTVIKDADKLSPYQVRGLVDNAEGSKGLFNHYKIKGIDVGKRIDRRERRRKQAKLSTTPKSTNIQKTSDMYKQAPKQASLVNNNEKIMDKQVKQAAFVKLATIKLAINYVLRNRLMSKQAAPGFGPTSQDPTMNMGYVGQSSGKGVSMPATGATVQVPTRQGRGQMRDFDTISNSMADPRSFQTLRKMITPIAQGVWTRKTNTYDFNGDWNAYQRERERIESGWQQMNEAEKAKYENSYKRHIAALNRWRDFQNMQNPTTPTKGQLAREAYNRSQALQQADEEYYNNIAPTLVANNTLDLQGDTTPPVRIAQNPVGTGGQSPIFADGSDLTLEDVLNGESPVPLFANGSDLNLEDILNGRSPENVPNNNQRHSILETGSSPVAMTNYEPYPGYNKAPY